MQIPLLLNAIPRRGMTGPTVPVNSGKWRVTTDLEDSLIHIQCDSPLGGFNVVEGYEFELKGSCFLKARVGEVGDEKSLSVWIREVE